METRRLELLVALARLGSMRAVAEALGVTTSTVSQQIAALAEETGAVLLEPVGRGVRLTPAGRRLADHGITILAAVDAARRDLDPDAEPTGTVRVAGFATAIRRALLPLLPELSRTRPNLRLVVAEHEPNEALALIDADLVDLAVVYDYELSPRAFTDRVETTPLWTVPWGLGVPAADPPAEGDAVATVGRYRDHEWIVNSRNSADEQVVATLAALAGFTPRLAHRADSLDLLQDMVAAGLGVGLLPEEFAFRDGVRLLPLRNPEVAFRAHAVVGRGRAGWPPLALVLGLLAAPSPPISPSP
jgi:DNA-binding transcriptional LysR family regulator